ncbi:MAG: hypothetical protein K2Q18_04540 [Bdellovibrionales bacterium]|nr:hypothetical protein [Bdellovibrionales bacterium]
MNKDDFKQTLIKQYSEVIEEMIVESETVYRSHLDFDQLDFRIRSLIQAARVDGLEEKIIWDILQRKVPDYYHFAINTYKIAA